MPISRSLATDLLRGLASSARPPRLTKRHERDVDEDAVRRPDLEGELPHRLEERQALDVAGRAADLGDEHVDVLAAG